MRDRLTRTVAPTGYPVTTAELNAWLKIDTSTENDLIDAAIAAATDHLDATGVLGRALLTQTWTMKLDDFPLADDWNRFAEIAIPLPPLQSVSSIAYLDSTGASQTLATSVYGVETGEIGRVYLKPDQEWPEVQDTRSAVTITFVAGYGAASAVPTPLKVAIRMLAGHFFEQRLPVITGTISSELPLGVQRLIRPYEVMWK